jgi:lipopolysaccharide export system protein LptC
MADQHCPQISQTEFTKPSLTIYHMHETVNMYDLM